MSSPALNEKTLQKMYRTGRAVGDTSVMTLDGTVNKTGILILLTMAGGALGWTLNSFPTLIAVLVVNIVLAILIIMKPERAVTLSQAYALSEGILLGSISVIYAQTYPGIVTNALLLTISCLILMLGLYRFRVIRVTEKTRSIIMVATMAIGVTYLVSIVLRLFGTEIPMIHQSTPLGIAFSVAVVGVAAFNLLLDFDMIEQAQAQRAPKYMEWYGGFALLVTLVWLYLEILRLLSKLNRK
jgi:uncharacterized YccA/Bax inhibitor family protein